MIIPHDCHIYDDDDDEELNLMFHSIHMWYDVIMWNNVFIFIYDLLTHLPVGDDQSAMLLSQMICDIFDYVDHFSPIKV